MSAKTQIQSEKKIKLKLTSQKQSSKKEVFNIDTTPDPAKDYHIVNSNDYDITNETSSDNTSSDKSSDNSKALTIYNSKVNSKDNAKNTSRELSTTISSTISSTVSSLFKKEKLSIEVYENPLIEELLEITKDEKFCFNFNNKSKSSYIEASEDSSYYKDYYKTFGKAEIYGLYENNSETKIKTIIGVISLICRYDNKMCQIMDLKIKKAYRGKGGIHKFILSTFFNRMFKYNGYYGISMNPNTIIETLTNKIMIPKMKNRGNMLIYLVSFDEINKILPILTSFYCSDISFIDNNKSRLIIDSKTKKSNKILHLHHNAEYRETIDFYEPRNGYQYCFSIHESNNFIIQDLKDKYKIMSSSSASIYCNINDCSDLIKDWSKFVKTYEI